MASHEEDREGSVGRGVFFFEVVLCFLGVSAAPKGANGGADKSALDATRSRAGVRCVGPCLTALARLDPPPRTRLRRRLVSILHAGGERARRGLLPSARTAGCVVVFVCARSSASRTRTPTCSSSARADSASRSRSRLEPHAPCLPAALCPPRLPRAQCQIYEADSEVVTGEMRDFSTLVPRLLEQLQRERDGQPLTSRRLVVFVFNGHNHYDATVPQ